ncbi:MAG: hypothetical protein AAF705_07745 [Bacteroidota bacterium]
MKRLLYLLAVLFILGLSSCRTSCGCPMAQADDELLNRRIVELDNPTIQHLKN